MNVVVLDKLVVMYLGTIMSHNFGGWRSRFKGNEVRQFPDAEAVVFAKSIRFLPIEPEGALT